MRKLLILWGLMLPFFVIGQDANDIMEGVKTKMNKIRDYSANVTIKADIPFIKIFPVKAMVYFKQKDKFRLKSNGIAILPKDGFKDISVLVNQNSGLMVLYTGSEMIQKTNTSIITMLPTSDTGDVILAKLWIDPLNSLVLKSQITSRSNGTVTAVYTYGAQKAFGLPDSVVFTVDVKKFKIPKGVATDLNKTQNSNSNSSSKTGKIYINFSNYFINKGISDEVFTKP